ncbi:MAG: hypothetical protein FWC97_04900 [Treponema sp.]|nr:hypothetical protein [Treponema sp.]
MRRSTFLIIFCLIILSHGYAFEDFSYDEFYEDQQPFRIRDRVFEIGFYGSVNFSNNFLRAGQIFTETLVLDIDNLADGFRMNLGAGISPFFFNINRGAWGFGLFTDIDAVGAISLSGNMLSLSQAINDRSDVSGAVFASAGVRTFFHVQNFKVRFSPAMFYPVVYMRPRNVSYTFSHTTDGRVILNAGYDFHIFSAFPLHGTINPFNITANPGFDLSFGIEYPLSQVMNSNGRTLSLDFDVGLDFINVPIAPSQMTDFLRIHGRVGSQESADIGDILNSIANAESETTHGTGNLMVERPFKMIVWANWRPIEGNDLFTLTPMFGFAISALSTTPVSPEIGLKAQLNLGNIFNPSFSISYEDHLWRNALNIGLNFRFVELNIGAQLQGITLADSWNTSGLGVTLGLKFGW